MIGQSLLHNLSPWRYFRKLVPGVQAKRMAGAYRRVFRQGGADQADREMVLVDLASKAGWNTVPRPSGQMNELYELGFAHGRQEVFAHIFNLLRLSPKEIAALEAAARADRQALQGSPDPQQRSQY